MLSVTALIAGIGLFVCVVAFAGYMLLSQQKRGQTDADEVTLNVAKLMNGDDRVGQMNNVGLCISHKFNQIDQCA
jgi:hypothetical protein